MKVQAFASQVTPVIQPVVLEHDIQPVWTFVSVKPEHGPEVRVRFHTDDLVGLGRHAAEAVAARPAEWWRNDTAAQAIRDCVANLHHDAVPVRDDAAPAEHARAARIRAWQMPGAAEVLLCDECWEAGMGLLAECQDDCNLRLDHDGECGPRQRAGAQTTCDRCGKTGRLTREQPENLDFE